MAYNPKIHHRRSIRLKGYDYSQEGAYFITLCTQDRSHLFGEVRGGEMQLNIFGQIAYQEWVDTTEIRSNVAMDVFVIMPNHMHGILLITSAGANANKEKGVCDTPRREIDIEDGFMTPRPLVSPSNTVGAIIRGYKAAVTRQINEFWEDEDEESRRVVWQRNYYEHIIRDERAYQKISEYIIDNPLKWEADMFFK